MTIPQRAITVLMCVLATMLTRFLPFLIFKEQQEPPKVIRYLGDWLPPAVFGMLLIYCLKGVHLFSGSHGLPEAIAIGVTSLLHLWKRQMLVSIAGGTIVYMLLYQLVF